MSKMMRKVAQMLKAAGINASTSLKLIVEEALKYRAACFENLLCEAEQLNGMVEAETLNVEFDSSCFIGFAKTHQVPAKIEGGFVKERILKYSMIVTSGRKVQVFNCETTVKRCGDQTRFPGMVEYSTTINGSTVEKLQKTISALNGGNMNLRFVSDVVTAVISREDCIPENRRMRIETKKKAAPEKEEKLAETA